MGSKESKDHPCAGQVEITLTGDSDVVQTINRAYVNTLTTMPVLSTCVIVVSAGFDHPRYLHQEVLERLLENKRNYIRGNLQCKCQAFYTFEAWWKLAVGFVEIRANNYTDLHVRRFLRISSSLTRELKQLN